MTEWEIDAEGMKYLKGRMSVCQCPHLSGRSASQIDVRVFFIWQVPEPEQPKAEEHI